MNLSTSDQILACARAAQAAWAAIPVSRRCAILGDLRREIALQCESIADTIARETSKPLLDALSGDVLVTLEHLRYYESYAARILRSRQIGKPSFFFRGARFEKSFEPHGVALIFGPSNYPFQLTVIPLITALAAGNAVILKCSERTPETAALIAKLCARANLPPNLVQVLHDGPEQSVALIDARPDFIFFTGSSRHGQQVAQRAAKQLIPMILELGGKDASLVFADCHLDRAIEGICYGAFSNAGRVCIAVKRAYIEASIYDDFLARLKQRIMKLRVDTDTGADFCPLSKNSQSDPRAQVEDALSRGATLRWPHDRAAVAYQPTLLSDVPSDARILTEESFGPVLCVASFRDEAEAIALANASHFGLSSSIWTHSQARARRIAAQLSAGSCSVNDVIRAIANPHAPFGGNRLSGYGRYHGPEGLLSFSRVRTIMLTSDRRTREINWFPFNGRTRGQLASLIRFRHATTGLVGRLSRILMPLLLSTILPMAFAAQSKPQAHLSIDVHLTPHARGELAYLIFASSSGFPGEREKALRQGFLPIPTNAQNLRIDADLPPGTYAVSVYEDINSNHKLDHNLIGIPREPVGVSNNPPARFGPPHFDQCSFHLGETSKIITITLVRAS
ncbi:aldehyde dehydrogenase family protein [Edaphobacter paludis]|uniref:Aldehyde dehydrogenase family protein n=1 Tax=Edaphobacter paludis TaxID=3035702 RepID=A0AAU7CTI2_9BACT